jgi:hypothetical protein
MIRNALSIRLVICMNECPIGIRLQKEEPLPAYQHTYDDTEDGRALALYHLEKIQNYVERHRDVGNSKKKGI